MHSEIPSENPEAAARHHATLRGLQRRLIAHLRAGRTTDLAPTPMRNPASVYVDAERHAREQQQLFLEQPLVAGLSGDIADVGDSLAFDGAGRPILVVRDEAGVARAFLNRCTHRGARLSEGGCQPALTCPFHGWTFDLSGRLVGLPGKSGFEGLDPETLGLVELPCVEWHGLIFVRATPGVAIDVEAHLGSFAPELAELQLQRYAPAKSGLMQSQGNWKYVIETFGEGYHFAQLHPDSLGQTHFNNVSVFDAFDRHHRVCFAPKHYKTLLAAPESEWPELDSVVYMIFPNTTMLVGSPMPGHHFVQLFRIYPTGISQTATLFSLYAPHEQLQDPQAQAIASGGYDLAARIIETEDFRMAGSAQRNFVQALPHSEVIYGRNEIALQHLHRQFDAALR